MSFLKLFWVVSLFVFTACGSGLEFNNVQTLGEALQSVPSEEATSTLPSESPADVVSINQNTEIAQTAKEIETVQNSDVIEAGPAEVTTIQDQEFAGLVTPIESDESTTETVETQVDTEAEITQEPITVEPQPAEVLTTRYYLDADVDSFGDPEVYVDVANQPEGYVANSGDCDDTLARISPTGLELPGNDYDENCDGSPLLYLNQTIASYEFLAGVKTAHSKWPARSLTYHNPIQKIIASETYPNPALSPSGLANNCSSTYYNDFFDNTLIEDGNDCVDVLNGNYKTSEAITHTYDVDHPKEITSSLHVKITDTNSDGQFDALIDAVTTTHHDFQIVFDVSTQQKISRTQTTTVDGVLNQLSYNTYDPQSDSNKLLKEIVDIGGNGSFEQVNTYTHDLVTNQPLVKTLVKGRNLETPSAQVQFTEVTTYVYDEYWGVKSETIVSTDNKGVVTSALREYINSYAVEEIEEL